MSLFTLKTKKSDEIVITHCLRKNDYPLLRMITSPWLLELSSAHNAVIDWLRNNGISV